MADERDAFEEFVRARLPALLRFAHARRRRRSTSHRHGCSPMLGGCSRTGLTVAAVLLAAAAIGIAVTETQHIGAHDTSASPPEQKPPRLMTATPEPTSASKPPLPPRQVVRVGWIDTAYDAARPRGSPAPSVPPPYRGAWRAS